MRSGTSSCVVGALRAALTDQTGMLRPLLEVLERGFYLPDPVVAPPCVRGQLVALSTALLEMLPSFSVIGDNVHGDEAVTVNLSLAVMCEMW